MTTNKRDSIPLLPCLPPWLPSSHKNTNGTCPQRLTQLALPNLCIVMAVLREHYTKLGQKQRLTLQNLIEKIEINSKRRYNQCLFEEAKSMINAKIPEEMKTIFKQPVRETQSENVFSKTKISKKVSFVKPLVNRTKKAINIKGSPDLEKLMKEKNNRSNKSFPQRQPCNCGIFPEKKKIGDKLPDKILPAVTKKPNELCKQTDYQKKLNDENKSKVLVKCRAVEKIRRTKKLKPKLKCINWNIFDKGLKIYHRKFSRNLFAQLQHVNNSFKSRNTIGCIEYSRTESEILRRILHDNENINNDSKLFLTLEPLYDNKDELRNLIFITETDKGLFNVLLILAKNFKLLMQDYIMNTSFCLEWIIRNISYDNLKRMKINSCGNKLDYFENRTFGHIDGHPPETVNYVCLAIYQYLQKQLKNNLKLYDTFKSECKKPILAAKFFYVYGAYHLWRLYSIHHSRILRSMGKIFRNKYITFCQKCFDVENFHEIIRTHDVPPDLIHAIQWNSYWSRYLLETLYCIRNAQI